MSSSASSSDSVNSSESTSLLVHRNPLAPPPLDTGFSATDLNPLSSDSALLSIQNGSSSSYGSLSPTGSPRAKPRGIFYGFYNNLAAGMTVSLINIPLSIALAVASQSTPIMGIITAVWAGFICAILGGSHYNITGPTGALSGILTKYVSIFGAECLPILSLTTAIFIFIVYVFKLDRYVQFLPSSVAHGFTLGVAFIIAGGQFPSMLGLPPLPRHENFFENMYEVFANINQADYHSFLVFFAFWITLNRLISIWPKVPWMVFIATAGIILGYLSKLNLIFYVKTLGDKYGDLTATLWQFPSFSVADPSSSLSKMAHDWSDVLVASASISFVAVLESLISGKIADGLTNTSMNVRKEVLGLAFANMISGLAGGIPATAALARTALNIRSGAKTRIAAVINSICTAFIALLLLRFFIYLPLCVVASLLFQVAVGMIEKKHLVKAYNFDRQSFRNTLIVGLMCLVFDPTMGIVIGAIIGLVNAAEQLAHGFSEVVVTDNLQEGTKVDVSMFDSKFRRQSTPRLRLLTQFFDSHTPTEYNPHPHPHPYQSEFDQEQRLASAHEAVIYRIVGDLSYLSSISHAERIRALAKQNKYLILSFRYCHYMDLDGLEMMEESLEFLRKKDKHRVFLCAINPMINKLMQKTHWFQNMMQDNMVFPLAHDVMQFLNRTQDISVIPLDSDLMGTRSNSPVIHPTTITRS